MLNNKIKLAVTVFIVSIAFILANFDFRLDRFGNAKISWSDCIQINNSKYYRPYSDIKVEESLIDHKIGEVTFNVSEKVGNWKYRFRHLDATFLKEGTEIYELNTTNNSVAAKFDGQYHLYIKEE